MTCCDSKIDYTKVEKSKLFSIEKRARTLKCLLDNLHLTWFSNEGFNPEYDVYYKVKPLLKKWNFEIQNLDKSEYEHVELAITRLHSNMYSAWVQKSTLDKIARTKPIIFRESDVMEILSIFSRVGVFNNLGEYIWI
jgi:hypothetical protein